MTTTRTIAQLAGPTIVAMTASELLHLPMWATNLPTLTYLNGMLLFLAGVAILRVHNRWVAAWPVLVTLTGWLSALGGLFRMFFPEHGSAPITAPTYAMVVILGCCGCVLTFLAYRPADAGASGR